MHYIRVLGETLEHRKGVCVKQCFVTWAMIKPHDRNVRTSRDKKKEMKWVW